MKDAKKQGIFDKEPLSTQNIEAWKERFKHRGA